MCGDGTTGPSPGRTLALEPSRPAFADPAGRLETLRGRVADLVASADATPHEGLRLLAYVHRLDPGGARRYFFELLRRLSADAGFQCAVG